MGDTPLAQLAGRYALVVIVALGLMVSQVFIKLGLEDGRLPLASVSDFLAVIKKVLTTPMLLIGYSLSGLVALVWLVLLSRMQLSLAVPLMSSVYYIFLLLVSALFLHEDVSGSRWLGAALILVGILVITRGNG